MNDLQTIFTNILTLLMLHYIYKNNQISETFEILANLPKNSSHKLTNNKTLITIQKLSH